MQKNRNSTYYFNQFFTSSAERALMSIFIFLRRPFRSLKSLLGLASLKSFSVAKFNLCTRGIHSAGMPEAKNSSSVGAGVRFSGFICGKNNTSCIDGELVIII